MPRYTALDFIRGSAILGILLLNIVGFGLPSAAYLNPAWLGQPGLADAWSWGVLDVLAQEKFLTLFALLFGVGLQLQLPRGSRWLSARLSWLALLGLLHGLLLWDGDILLAYALCGLIVWRLLRDAPSSQTLFKTGVLLYLAGCLMLLVFAVISHAPASSSWTPGAAELQYERFWKLAGGSEAVQNRLDILGSGLMALATQYGWQLVGLMMIGAALLRCGWLTGGFSAQHYRRCALWLLGSGFAVNLLGTVLQWQLHWGYRWSGFYLQLPRSLASPLVSLGYAALILAFWPRLERSWPGRALQCVGRMALSNYLLQTLICTTLFYHFALFAQFSRFALLAFVPAIWLVNILFSIIWLRIFRQGPLEWIWRRLTLLASRTTSGR